MWSYHCLWRRWKWGDTTHSASLNLGLSRGLLAHLESSLCVSSGSCLATLREKSDPHFFWGGTQAGTLCSDHLTFNSFSERKDVPVGEQRWPEGMAEVLDLETTRFLGVEDLLRQTAWNHLWEHTADKTPQMKPSVTFNFGNEAEGQVSLASTQT